jgi:nitroimidazol reductase NimA-like FMN-containing flavoprotein (pyridoxamine 5'-phosphate oxidase superfamily)
MSTTTVETKAETKQSAPLTPTELRLAVHEYIKQTRWGTLTTVREDGAPVSRAMGSFAPDGANLFFSTPKKAAKVRHIAKNNLVNFFFQHEGQDLATFKNVAVIGRAEEVTGDVEYQRAVQLLSARNPRFKARAERGELKETSLFLIRTTEIKYLDYSRGVGPIAIQEIIL